VIYYGGSRVHFKEFRFLKDEELGGAVRKLVENAVSDVLGSSVTLTLYVLDISSKVSPPVKVMANSRHHQRVGIPGSDFATCLKPNIRWTEMTVRTSRHLSPTGPKG